MKTIISRLVFLFVVLLFGCTQTDQYMPISNSDITLVVEYPIKGGDTRATFVQEKESYNMISEWEDDDKMQGFIEQEGKVYKLDNLPLFDVKQSKAKIRISFPRGFNKEKPFVFHGIYGREGYYSLENNSLAYSGEEQLSQNLRGFKPALYTKSDFQNGKDSKILRFQHYGVYEVIHIKNTDSKPVTLGDVYPVFMSDNTRPWAHSSVSLVPNSSWCYFPMSNKIERGSRIISSLKKQFTTIESGEIKAFVSWFLPTGKPYDDNTDGIALHYKSSITSKEQSSAYKSEKVKRKVPIMGNTYHFYASWDGKQLTVNQAEENLKLSLERIDEKLEGGKTKKIIIKVTSGKATSVRVDRADIATATIEDEGKSISLSLIKSGMTKLIVSNGVKSLEIPISVSDEPLVEVPQGVIIKDGVLVKWPNNVIPKNGHVTIPNSVTRIGNSAFFNCSRLSSVTIPNSVISIGNNSFHECRSLSSVTIPNSVTSIGTEAFSYCYRLSSVTIPNSVTSIWFRAFYGCISLSYVTIPNSVTSIGTEAFSGCSGLSSVVIPNSVTNIGESAFSGCSSLSSVVIPNSVASIGGWAFSGCSGLSSVVIPNSVTGIEVRAFSGCSGLSSVTIPNSVTSIGASAFSGCSGLSSVVIPNSVTNIGESAFYGCSSLSSFTIPKSVNSVGKWSFSACSKLTSITCKALTPPRIVTYFGYRKKLIVPIGTKHLYEKAIGWKDCNPIVEENL